MTLSKIQAESMNLADTYAFTGTVSGAGGGIFESQLLHVRDEKASGTNGGTSINGINTRDLNTVKTNEITGASLSSNQITLPSGTFYISASTATFAGGNVQLYLYNVTDSSNEVIGNCNNFFPIVNARFTISAQKVFEIRMKSSSPQSNDGLGRQVGVTTEVYTDVHIWKVA
jgi:hypothetical protein